MSLLLPRHRQSTFSRPNEPSQPQKLPLRQSSFPLALDLCMFFRVSTWFVLTTLALIFLLPQPHILYKRFFLLNNPTVVTPAHVPTRTRPPPLSVNLPLQRDTPFATSQAAHSWLQPLVFTAYTRITKKPYLHTELFLYTTGISMGTFQRNFSIVGCVVGNDVYPLSFTHFDSAMCRVTRPVDRNERVSVALANDSVLQDALARGIELSPGVVVALNEGDVYAMPAGMRIHFPANESVAHGDMMIARSVAKAGKSGGMKENMGTEGRRYEVCMATQMKMYPYLLDDWISYHRRLGVDMVYVLDNDSEEDLNKWVDKREDVEVVYWPWGRSQVQAWSWLLLVARERCEWVLLADADEFVMFGIGREGAKVRGGVGLMREFVRRLEREAYDEAFLQFIVMANSGYDRRPDGPLAEQYLHKYMVNGTNGKSLLRTDSEWKGSNVHRGNAVDIGKTKTFWARDGNIYPEERGEAGRIVHFQFRSWEERAVKERIGSGSIHDRHSVTGRDIGDASNGYLRVFDERQYTHFRKIWRIVMNEKWGGEQVLVRRKQGGGKCWSEIVEKRIGEEVCEEE